MVVHLYGVTTADTPLRQDLKGRQEGALRLVSDGALAVIVSDFDADIPAGRKDLLAHAHVLEAYAEQTSVIPMQFGIALPSDDDVREQVIERDRESLEHLLKFFETLVQVSVQAFHQEEPALRQVLLDDSRLMDAREQMKSFPETATPARQVELGQAVASGLEVLQEKDRQILLDALTPLAVAVAESKTSGALEVVNAAFLVRRDARTSFDKAVGALRFQSEERIRIRYVGPQPPYSFIEPVRMGELAWD